MDKRKFGTYIKEKRLEQGFTQKELADLLVIDVTAVSKWERGVTYPDITMIPDICKYLKVNEHELIASSNDTQYRKTVQQAKQYGKLKNGVFYSFLIGYAVALVTCFTVNLAVSHTLSWFFIVAAGCLCGFSFMPTFTRFFERGKLTVFVLTTLASLCVLYLACAAHTGIYWCWFAMAATVLGYFAVFAPILFAKQKAYLTEAQYTKLRRFYPLLYAVGLFVLTVLLLLCINAFSRINLALALKITAYSNLILLAVGLTELLPANRLLRRGLESYCMAGYLFGMNGVFNTLLNTAHNGFSTYYAISFSDWEACSNGNVSLIALLLFVLVGTVLLCLGARKQ